MARIPTDHPRTPKLRLLEALCRRRFGRLLDPVAAAFHNPRVLNTSLATEFGAGRWNQADPTLKALAVMAVSAEIGCSWCLDFGYWESRHQGVDPAKLRAVTDGDPGGVLTEAERLAVDFAIASTTTPPTVDDAMVAALRERMTDAALVELTAMIALENQRSRFNAAMGLTAQGFKELCEYQPHGDPTCAAQ
ncbi:carboxymuconolactone decarboxylase family protein [Zafaria sp. Z1313]|uniref:carboxymuconolactone decarboxylase family protein n=1 Tax=Zafaria sp. Z1313 TaxID=3423202 RepID=UPI003D301A21